MTAGEIHRAIEAVFRIERARLIAGLARLVRDFDRAEELAQDALVVALNEWPHAGVPANPGAWLMTAAKRRGIDALRRDRMRESKHAEIARETEGVAEAITACMSDDLGDELLGLIFTACHPVLSPDSRTALTLRVVGGLTTDEIARAFLSSEATIAQRIVRAKKTIGTAGLRFEVPRGAARPARLASVLEVVYLIFNEGYAATAGDALVRPDLCLEAQRLGRMLARLMPEDSEVFGLLALMEIQASRLQARMGPDGALVPLTEQNRTRWDQLSTRRGFAALARADALGGSGPYALQAALAACHARARRPEDTDWPRIAALYDRLRVVMPSPVVDLNRAVAHSMAFGTRSGLATGRCAFRRCRLAELCAVAGGAWRLPVSVRPPGRGARGIRGCGEAYPQCARGGVPAGARGGLRVILLTRRTNTYRFETWSANAAMPIDCDFRKLPIAARAELRRVAVNMVLGGTKRVAVAEAIGVNRRFVGEWMRAYEAQAQTNWNCPLRCRAKRRSSRGQRLYC